MMPGRTTITGDTYLAKVTVDRAGKTKDKCCHSEGRREPVRSVDQIKNSIFLTRRRRRQEYTGLFW
jgi:hypothetical protein